MRKAIIDRQTKETKVHIELDLDGSGRYSNKTGVGFFDHMLDEFAKQTLLDLTIETEGDLYVDAHHTVEDTGIALGQALSEALGDCRGINRYGFFVLPMDEALLLCSIDLCGRPTIRYDVPVPAQTVGNFDTELAREFFTAVANNAKMALHLKKLDGENTHHILEGAFKAFGRALAMACAIDPLKKDQIPSTKGIL